MSPCEITQFCTRHNDIENNMDFNGLTMFIKMLQFGSRRRNSIWLIQCCIT